MEYRKEMDHMMEDRWRARNKERKNWLSRHTPRRHTQNIPEVEEFFEEPEKDELKKEDLKKDSEFEESTERGWDEQIAEAKCETDTAMKCPDSKSTLFTISIPPNTTINVLNFFEIVSPSGICLEVRTSRFNPHSLLPGILDTFKKAGCSIEFISQ